MSNLILPLPHFKKKKKKFHPKGPSPQISFFLKIWLHRSVEHQELKKTTGTRVHSDNECAATCVLKIRTDLQNFPRAAETTSFRSTSYQLWIKNQTPSINRSEADLSEAAKINQIQRWTRLPVPSKSPDFLQQHQNHHITDLPSPCSNSKNGHHYLIFRRPKYHPRNLATKNCWTRLHSPVHSTGIHAHGLTHDPELRSVTLTRAALPMMTSALVFTAYCWRQQTRKKKCHFIFLCMPFYFICKKKKKRKLALTCKKEKKKNSKFQILNLKIKKKKKMWVILFFYSIFMS